MGTCYSVQGKGEVRPYFTVKPLSRGSPVLQGDHSQSCSPAKADLDLPPKSVLKNSPNWSNTSSPLFEKKVQRQVSFDLMSDLFSESPSHVSTPLHQQNVPAGNTENSVPTVSDQDNADSLTGAKILSVWCSSVLVNAWKFKKEERKQMSQINYIFV